jgi:hypothetical protein
MNQPEQDTRAGGLRGSKRILSELLTTAVPICFNRNIAVAAAG